MAPRSGAPPKKGGSRKRTHQESTAGDNQTLDNFVTKKPRTSSSGGPPDGESSESSGPKSKGGRNQLDQNSRPISDIDAAFWDMVMRSKKLLSREDGKVLLRVATMCSGTEAPMKALEMIRDTWERVEPGKQFLQFVHVFSAEIVPYKQSYIMRNTDGVPVFNDVQDFVKSEDKMAPTAMGSFEKIPEEVDIVVSGCSCVDFSSLNTAKTAGYKADNLKTEHKYIASLASGDGYNDGEYDRVDGFFKECLQSTHLMGSSAKTFFSMMCYVRDYKPKVVILENVLGAPWGEMQNVWFPFLGYTAAYAKLDTKDYYIPQTRNRGYLIALRNEIFAPGKTYAKKGEEGKEIKKYDADNIVEEWLRLLKALKRRASSAVGLWLLPAAHPLTERARQDDSEKALEIGSETVWQRAKMIHIRTRRNENLGNSRELTQWGSRKAQPYDRMDKNIVQNLTNRVADCIEIDYLRMRLHGYLGHYPYDSRFKNRIYDLSQNIDRSVAGSPFGIAGCLTPSGIHYLSDQCRMVSGYEALILQGLPLHRLEFATETQDQLRDLAGNAMSTTVVGAVFVALFGAIFAQPKKPVEYFNNKSLPEDKPRPRLVLCSDMDEFQGFSTMNAAPFQLADIKRLYARSRRYCFCNGAAKYSTDDFVECRLCLTIRCRWCAGNPTHVFGEKSRPADYLLLSEVEQEVMRFFPGTILGMTTANWLRTSSEPLKEATIMDVDNVLEKLRDVSFYYEGIRVTEVITICYSGQWGFDMRAKISGSGIAWYLYLDPWSELGLALRRVLVKVDPELAKKYVRSPQPIAKAEMFEEPVGVFPRPEIWKLWHFKNIGFRVPIKRDRNDVIVEDIYFKNDGDSTHRLGLESVFGTYSHSPICDGPENSLHVREEKQERMFLFKDVSRTLTPDFDGYVISKSCRQLEYHEYREVLIKFNASINMSTQQTGEVDAYVDGYWMTSPSRGVYKSDAQKHEVFKLKEKLEVFGTRHSIVTIVRNEGPGQEPNRQPEQRVLAEAQIVREQNCDPYKSIAMYHSRCKDASDGWAIVTKADLHHLHSFISHINVKLAGVQDLEVSFELNDIEHWLRLFKGWKEGMATASRRECPYGQLPPVRWIKVGNGGRYVGHHLSDAMADFEKRHKSRIPIFEPRVKVLSNPAEEEEPMHCILVQYLFQHKALGQKAAVLLPPTRDYRARVTAGVRVERNAVITQNMQVNSDGNSRHKFEPFRNGLQCLNNILSRQPPDKDALKRQLVGFKTKLADSQLNSLAWVLGREKGEPKFTEQEIEEEIVPELKLRLVGCAKRTVINHGGVLADDVGYGKTVIMLALMHHQQEFDGWKASKQTPGCICLKATLVVVPDHLVDQWAKEALRFLPIGPGQVFTIKSASDLQDDHTRSVLTRLREARIIVVNAGIFDLSYHNRLARLAGSLDPPDSAINTRSFRDWYKDAAPAARVHVGALFGTPNPDISGTWDAMNKRTQRLGNEYKLYAEDLARRVKRSSTNVKGEDEKGDGKKSDQTDEDVKTNIQASHRMASCKELFKEMHGGRFLHVLDGFTFARAVYDEFSYQDFPAMTFFTNCSARAKWILSATPPTRNLADVQGIANLINIHVARPIYSRVGMPRVTEGPAFDEQTNAELLQNRKLMSDSCIRERHEKGIEFLRTCATVNPLDASISDKLQVDEKVIVCELSKQEAIQYMTLEHDLRACGLDANMLSAGCRAYIQTLVDPQEWSDDGKNVSVRAFLTQSSCSTDTQSPESLLQERRDQAQRAVITFRAYVEKAIWLALRVLNNGEESTYDNAKAAVADIITILKDIWKKDIEICGGEDAWKEFFEALDVGEYEQRFQELNIAHPFFDNDNKKFLRFLFDLRKSSWNDYFDLKAKHMKDIGNDEAGELLADLFRVHGDTSLVSHQSNKAEKAKDRLAVLIGNQEKGLEKFRREQTAMQRPPPGEKPSFGSKFTKAIYTNQLKSIGVIVDPKYTLNELKERFDAHYAGTLDDSEYVGINDSRGVKRAEFPTFGRERTVRGGKYTHTRSETSDTSVGLRAAFDQLDLAIKQKRIAENLILEKAVLPCDRCQELKLREDLHIVYECGHVLCASHLNSKYCGGEGPKGAIGCRSLLEDATKSLALLNRPRRFLDHEVGQQVEDRVPGFSSKSQMIVNCIKGIPKEEHAILFYQFDRQKKELIEALHQNAISYTTSTQDETTDKVRLLQLEDKSAAGTNFQYANHVMFVCPLLKSLQEDYDKDMKQAKGRCIRWGQEKVVHVYHFVTAHTIEVDILELRKKCHIMVSPGKAVGELVGAPPARNKKLFGNSGSSFQGGADTNIASTSQSSNGQRVNSMLTSDEIWKVMNEANWLNTVGIEY